MIKLSLFILFLLFNSIAFSQVDTTDTYNKIETLLEDVTQDQEDSQIYDSIEDLLSNPILLNQASINDLLKIPFLNLGSARALIVHRNKLGGIYNEDQLKNVPDLSDELIEKIIPFLKLGDGETITIFDAVSNFFTNVNFEYRARTINDIQKKQGFLNSAFQGSQPKVYNRLKLKSTKKINAGFLAEKDAGEKSIVDFTSFHFQLNDFSIFKTIILGDYIFEFGQGLALWSPYSFSKGSDAIGTVSRNGRGPVSFISTDENQYLRGAAVQLQAGSFTFSPFFSAHQIDASIDPISLEVTSRLIDGYHRTVNEIAKKDRLNEKLYGLSTEYFLNETTKFGLLYYSSIYDHEFEKSSLLERSGSKFDFASASYSSAINKLFISGEFSYTNNSLATINSAELFIDKNFSLIFSYRNFPQDYVVFHGNSFGEKGTAQNETGFYSGFYLRTDYGNINFYYDQFKYSLASSTFLFPSNGTDFLIYYTYKIFTNTELRIRYKNESKDNIVSFGNENGLAKRRAENIRTEIFYKVSKNISLRTRFETVNISALGNSPKEKGYLLFQDIRYTPISRLNFYSRIIFFSTESYDSRIYEFENDLLGIMTNPAMYGEGICWYFIAKYNSPFGLNISLKYSELYKPNERILSSGNSQINGNLDNRLSLQLDFKF